MIINIVLVLLLVHSIAHFITKPKATALSCGLFGWVGSNVKHFNKEKLEVLGIYNDKRGGHSCGLYIDGNIKYGLDKNKLFEDFVKNIGVTMPKEIPVVMGHTRKASKGIHNMANAHPFGFGTSKKDPEMFAFAGSHNGTLYNEEDIAKANGIQIVRNNNTSKIDSEILLEAIYKNRKIDILSTYIGAAALVWTFVDEPNTVYFFHGKSKLYQYAQADTVERPLYYLQESVDSAYYSSIKESLELIALYNKEEDGKELEVKEIEPNRVYKVVNGRIDKAVRYKVNRDKAFQREYVKTYYPTTTTYDDYNDLEEYPYARNLLKRNNRQLSLGTDLDGYRRKGELYLPKKSGVVYHDKTEPENIYDELSKINPNDHKGGIYFNRLRYWRNGHLITGIYTWIPNRGFHYLALEMESVFAEISKIVDKALDDNDCFVPVTSKDDYIPFETVDNKIPDIPILYFFNGIRMLTGLDYRQILTNSRLKVKFTTCELSFSAAHPIIDLNRRGDHDRQFIFHKGKLFNGTVCPIESEFVYEMKLGNLISRRPRKTNNNKNIIDVAYEELEKEANNYDYEVGDKLEADLVMNEIDKVFTNNFKSFPEAIKRLKKYSKSAKAKHAISILEKFLNETKLLIGIDYE